MNYAGFTRPVWTWLRGDDAPADAATVFFGLRSEYRGFRASRSFGR